MKTAQQSLCILTLLLLADLFYVVTSTLTIETTETDTRGNPNVNDIFTEGRLQRNNVCNSLLDINIQILHRP